MNLGSQYYRAPFPDRRYWRDDLTAMRASGLNTVQLWVLWAWVEAKPGEFVFDDYDELIALAGELGLSVVLSAIAEIQPYWIPREVPGSEMVTNFGQRIVSSNRGECHFGLTPGGCTDHPGVWARMRGFLETAGRRYADAPHLAGWDAWNELRWNVNADGQACYCAHTVAAFRAWLERRYDSLDGLNRAWKRRYGAWDEVLPGKLPERPYTEMMAFEEFIAWRANAHARARYEILKPFSPHLPVTVHGGDPTPLQYSHAHEFALGRGNDWFYADDTDGTGCSSFPRLHVMDSVDFAVRVNHARSAARGKAFWLSELQGGAASLGFRVYDPVDAFSQQQWVWNGIAAGAKTILFWCWRDEVFGNESSGFGLAGSDGKAAERLAALTETGRVISENAALIDAYRPDPDRIGALFSPATYELVYAQEGTTTRALDSLNGCARALTELGFPFLTVEENHLDVLQGLRILFLPQTLVMSSRTEDRLIEFVRGGGTLVCESECGAFTPEGFYRYPGDRFLARMADAREVGRRPLTGPTVLAQWPDGASFALPATQWLTPWRVGAGEETPLAVVPVEAGRVILCGSYPGSASLKEKSSDYRAFVERCVREADALPDWQAEAGEESVRVVSGRAEGRPVLFVFTQTPDCRVRLCHTSETALRLRDLLTGREAVSQEGVWEVFTNAWGVACLAAV